MNLRPYQRSALEALENCGLRRPLLAHATGTGKTVTFSHWINGKPGRTLILAHRDELLTQAEQKLRMVNPDVSIGVVKAERNEWHTPIVLGSVQTLANLKRLRQLMSLKWDRIIVDEAHHTAADSYQRILAALGAWTDGGPIVLGVTATPTHKRGLGDIFDGIVHSYSIVDGIKDGYLCDLRALSIAVDADFNKLRSRGGDIIESEAEEMLMQCRTPEAIADAIHQHAMSRPTLVFTPGVESAHAVARACKRLGFEAEGIDGTMDDRKPILRDFAMGNIQILANCAVLTEGYDEPSVACVVMASPTQSQVRYAQCVGRGTRVHPDKKDCLILDVVGNVHRHDLMTLPQLFEGQISQDEKLTNGVMAGIERAKPEGGRVKLEPTDLWSARSFAWVKSNLGYVLSLGGKAEGWLLLSLQSDGWKAWIDRPGGGETLGAGLTMAYAQGIAEDYVRNSDAAILSRKSASWRKADVSDGQKRMMRLWRVPYFVGMTKGEASDAITQAIANARARTRR